MCAASLSSFVLLFIFLLLLLLDCCEKEGVFYELGQSVSLSLVVESFDG